MVDGPTPYPTPVGIAYQPGNGTRYDLIFVSVRSVQQATGEFDPENGTAYVPSGVFENDRVEADWVLVTQTNGEGFSYPFQLTFGSKPAAPYVARSANLNYADACAVTALLRAITGAALT